MPQQELQKKLDKVIDLVLIKVMEILKGLDKISKVINQIDYENVYVKINTKDDTYILDKTRPKNKIGFEVKGGE